MGNIQLVLTTIQRREKLDIKITENLQNSCNPFLSGVESPQLRELGEFDLIFIFSS